MGIISFPIILIAASLQVSAQMPVLVAPHIAAQQLAGCGFSAVRPVFNETLQEEVLEVRDVVVATDEQLTCAAKVSLSTVYYLAVPDALRKRYDAIYWRLAKERDVASARQWLAERGMLARLPQYKEGEDEAFAKQLEEFCGGRAKGALQSEFGPHAISPEWVIRELTPPDLGDDTLQCLTSSASAAGFKLGIIGNEAYAAPK
jgi:hypothetical protein